MNYCTLPGLKANIFRRYELLIHSCRTHASKSR